MGCGCHDNENVRRKRIGNDLRFNWTILDGESPYDLEGKDLTLAVRSPFGVMPYGDLQIEGNVISFTLYGKDQKVNGLYTAILQENAGEIGMKTVDITDIVMLVPHTRDEGGEDRCSHLSVETIDLTSQMTTTVPGPKGDTGNGIESVEQIQTSLEDSGENIVRVTLTDGTTSYFSVRNGAKGSDANVTRQNIETALNGSGGKNLSTNDYTDEDKDKLAGVEEGANKNVKPDWNESDTDSDAFIRNKPDLSGFITRTVNDLGNYYLKSETYTKEEVAALIGAIRQFHYEVYTSRPATGEGNVLYLIGPTGSGSDKYEEYVYANNGWVKIGDTSIDLSGYVTIEVLNQALAGYVTSADFTTLLAAKVNEEDLDFNADDKLQLADRVYNTSTPDGLGYVILRKNKTFAQQVKATNTIYEIRYDFDLGGDEVTIPAGCELRFIGGRIGGEGKIVGTGTFINSEGTCFGKNVALSGTWANEIVYTKWLSFISAEDGVTDNSLCFKQLQAIINGTKGCRVEFVPGTYQTQIIGMEPEGYVEKDGVTYPKWAMNTYQVDARVVLNIFELKWLEIDMRGATIKAIGITCPCWNMIRLNGVQDSSIHDGTLIGMADGFDYPDYVNYANTVTNNYEFSVLLYQVGGSCRIQNMACEYSTGDGIIVGSNSWYFRTGDVRPTGVVQANGLVRFPAEGYSVIGCEVRYCGRNGITLHSSEQGELADCHIHHIGSDAGNGDIGSDGIQGRSPRAGIDVEFEDGQGLMPIMRWEGLYIHDCGGKSFGFASVSQSKMRQFSARNCRFIRLGVNNNLNAEGPKEFVNCYFEHNGGEGSLLGAGTTFRDCQFILKTYSLLIGQQTFENCVITDEYAEEDNSHYMFSENHEKGIFRNCVLTIRHSYGYLQDKTFHNCVLNFYWNGIIYGCGVEFYDCEFHKDPDDDTVYSIGFASGNYAGSTRRHFWFVRCTFDTLRGYGSGVSSFAFSTIYPIVLDGCKFTDRLSFYAGGNTGPDITIRDSTFNALNVNRYNDAGDNVKPVLIDGCVVDSFTIGLAGTRAVEVKDSKIGIAAGGNYKLQKVHFTRCEVTNYVARPNSYPDVDVTAVDSILDFVVATSTSAFDLTKCYVKGLVTEASFAGVKKDCTFETSFPKSGATADRPSASAVGAGFTYFDTDLGKMVVSNGTDWVNMDGTAL